MEAPVRQQSFWQRKITKQLMGKRGDPILNLAVREGNLKEVLRILTSSEDVELKGLLSMQNQSGETTLYVAAECGYVDIVKELIKHYDMGSAAIKAKNGYDAFHVAAKQGNLGANGIG